jgi:protein TilB
LNEPPFNILHICFLTTPRVVPFGCEQKNEGAQQYTLTDSADGRSVVLEVAVGRYLDTAQVKVDVQPLLVRCLVRGRLLQLHTPEVGGAQPLCACLHLQAQ